MLVAIYLFPCGSKGDDANHVQQQLKHHDKVTRQVDDGGVDDEGDQEDEEGVEDVALYGLQHRHSGDDGVVKVAVTNIVGKLCPQ